MVSCKPAVFQASDMNILQEPNSYSYDSAIDPKGILLLADKLSPHGKHAFIGPEQ